MGAVSKQFKFLECFKHVADTKMVNTAFARPCLHRHRLVSPKFQMYQEIQRYDIDAELVNESVCLNELPEPDLFIRTGGEQRISNFLIWQLAYTELYFSDVLWPDFSSDEFEDALNWYASRQRRFGKTGEQIDTKHPA